MRQRLKADEELEQVATLVPRGEDGTFRGAGIALYRVVKRGQEDGNAEAFERFAKDIARMYAAMNA